MKAKNSLFVILAGFFQLVDCGTFYDKKYAIINHATPLSNSNIEDSLNFTQYSVNSNGMAYNCWIPHVELEANSFDITNENTTWFEIEKRHAIDAIKNFNLKYRGNHVKIRNGYWTYMLRFDHDIYQYHQNENIRIENGALKDSFFTDFKLASWTDDDKTLNFNSQPYYNFSPTKDPYSTESDFEMLTMEDGTKYVTQRIGNGEICDLTGLPRAVIIKYLCNDKIETPIITNLNEWKTCEYALDLESNYFCNFTMWTPPKELVNNKVNCYPENDDINKREIEILQFDDVKIEPLINGIFLGRNKLNSNKFFLLLTKDYDIWVEDIEGTTANTENIHRLLTDISLGFQIAIRNKRLSSLSDNSPVVIKWDDRFKLVSKLYDIDRTLMGNFELEQDENGFLVSHFVDYDVPEETNFIDFQRKQLTV